MLRLKKVVCKVFSDALSTIQNIAQFKNKLHRIKQLLMLPLLILIEVGIANDFLNELKAVPRDNFQVIGIKNYIVIHAFCCDLSEVLNRK